MEWFDTLTNGVVENWPIWLVTVVLIVAAVIDGIKLKVPNWITFPMVISGWIYSMVAYSMQGDAFYVGLGWSLAGTAVGLALLLPAYSIGGMGAGDVKLMAGIGAWMHVVVTFYSFCLSAIIGAILAVAMVLIQRKWFQHYFQFKHIMNEIVTVRDPEKLSAIAAERKPTMMLLPYGIPIAMGTILYFAWMGMLI